MRNYLRENTKKAKLWNKTGKERHALFNFRQNIDVKKKVNGRRHCSLFSLFLYLTHFYLMQHWPLRQRSLLPQQLPPWYLWEDGNINRTKSQIITVITVAYLKLTILQGNLHHANPIWLTYYLINKDRIPEQ